MKNRAFYYSLQLKSITIIFFVGVLFSNNLFSQVINNIIAENFDAAGKVIEITLPESYEGRRFNIGFLKNGQTYGFAFIGRAGKHYYDLRGDKAWEGRINGVATDLPKETEFVGKLKNATLEAEFDIFFAPEKFSPTTINLVWLKTFFGMRWSVVLFFTAILLGVIIYFVKKTSVGIALSIGIVMAIVLMDLRTTMDHIAVIQDIEQTYPYVSPLGDAQKIVKTSKPIMVDGIWQTRGIYDEFQNIYIKSQLAGLPVRKEEGTNPKIYTITNQPNSEEKILAQEGVFYLVSNQ